MVGQLFGMKVARVAWQLWQGPGPEHFPRFKHQVPMRRPFEACGSFVQKENKARHRPKRNRYLARFAVSRKNLSIVICQYSLAIEKKEREMEDKQIANDY